MVVRSFFEIWLGELLQLSFVIKSRACKVLHLSPTIQMLSNKRVTDPDVVAEWSKTQVFQIQVASKCLVPKFKSPSRIL